MGNGINWKGQIFPKMQNFTPTHKMTGIGNALKTKYQQLLLDYERVCIAHRLPTLVAHNYPKSSLPLTQQSQ